MSGSIGEALLRIVVTTRRTNLHKVAALPRGPVPTEVALGDQMSPIMGAKRRGLMYALRLFRKDKNIMPGGPPPGARYNG